MNQTPCHIFFHIPKTGGLTFHNLLNREYQNKVMTDTHTGMLSPQTWERFTTRFMRQPEVWRASYRVVKGHMKFGVHEMLPGPSCYLTFLRQPVKRTVSYYAMVKGNGRIPVDHQVDLSRPDWNLSVHESLAREFDNCQTRALANADWNLPFGECTEDHLKMAQANMDKYFAFVGLTERFDLSLMLLRRLCGWRWHFYVSKNVARRRALEHGLSPDVLKALAKLNRFDDQLYAYAQERFEREIHRYGLSLQMEYGVYHTGNLLHKAVHHVVHPIKNAIRGKKKKTVSLLPIRPASASAKLAEERTNS